jgi:hypothetical protein
MKNILKILFVFMATGALFFSCENEATNFDALVKAPDANASYYLQFIDAAQSLETGVTVDGDLIEIQTTIAVVLMGSPQAQDITVNLAVDPASTIASDMYTLTATSITIPAGQTSGSVDLTTIAAKMPVGQQLELIINMDAGEHNSPNPVGTKIDYMLKRIEFCPLVNGVADLVGSWSGSDAGYTSIITTAVNGEDLDVSGMGVGFIEDFWAETPVAGGTFTMTVYGNGIVDIPRQHLFTTLYGGANYDYDIKGSGKWTNCGANPTLLITYDIYYEGEDAGLAQQYAAYLGGIPYLTADITLSGKKSLKVSSYQKINQNIIRPSFKR